MTWRRRGALPLSQLLTARRVRQTQGEPYGVGTAPFQASLKAIPTTTSSIRAEGSFASSAGRAAVPTMVRRDRLYLCIRSLGCCE
jgi:hypothetical protein